MDLGFLSFSFSAGMVAFFNPCGSALLPAFISHYLGLDEKTDNAVVKKLFEGMKFGLSVSAGILVSFSLVGFLLALIGSIIAQVLPWLSTFLGIVLVALGLFMLLGKYHLAFPFFPNFVKIIQSRQTGIPLFFLYGVSFAIASLGCTLPIFSLILAQSFSKDTGTGLLMFFAYSLGMATMMISLTMVMVFSKDLLYKYIDSLIKYVFKVRAFILIGAGIYVVYYNLKLFI